MTNASSPLVSVVIPTFNRFFFLLHAIRSVVGQTYGNLEIVVVNDRSTAGEYYKYDFGQFRNLSIVHLEQNSKAVVGHACAALVRNHGMQAATGKYIAFLDDDDVWLPEKLTLQIGKMEKTGRGMSCTEGYLGKGVYEPWKKHPRYLEEGFKGVLQEIYKNTGYLKPDFPDVWTRDFLQIHNCCITSTVVVRRELMEQAGYMALKRNGEEDYDCWLKILNLTDCDYLREPCAYYDAAHGHGNNY